MFCRDCSSEFREDSRKMISLLEDISKRDRLVHVCRNRPSIYSSVAFHLKKATGHGHFQFLAYNSRVTVLKDLKLLVLSDGISPSLSNR